MRNIEAKEVLKMRNIEAKEVISDQLAKIFNEEFDFQYGYVRTGDGNMRSVDVFEKNTDNLIFEITIEKYCSIGSGTMIVKKKSIETLISDTISHAKIHARNRKSLNINYKILCTCCGRNSHNLKTKFCSDCEILTALTN